jgi:hypothetical protein
MEIAAAITSSLAAAFSTTATAAGAAGTAATAASAAGSGFSLMSLLQGGATALSIMGTIRAGQAAADQAAFKEADARTEAGMEQAKGIERRNEYKRAMIQDLGARDVAAGAGGVDLAFGTPAMARDQATADANRALSTDAETENIRRQRLYSRAAAFRMAGEEATSAATIKALTQGVSGLADLGRRR